MQVLTYDTTEDMKWCLLGGIAAGADNCIDGNMQLYSAEKKVSQPLTGHAAAFITIKVPDRSDPAEVLVFHQKTPGVIEQKLYVMEVRVASARSKGEGVVRRGAKRLSASNISPSMPLVAHIHGTWPAS